MTSKISLAKLIKEAVKRGSAFGILLLLFFFCYFPLGAMMMMNNMTAYMPYSRSELFREFGWQITNGFLYAAVFLIALIMGILQFSYLHSREKLDFYHSLPVRRETMFTVQFLSGVLLFFAPLAVNMLLYLLVCALNGVASILAAEAFRALIAYLCCFLLIYSFMVLAMMLTGKIFAAVLGMAVFCGYLPAVGGVWELMMSYFFSTYCPVEINQIALLKGTPVYAVLRVASDMMKNLTADASGRVRTLDVQLALLLIALLTAALCIWLYRRRPSEKAGVPMAFPTFARVVKFMLVVPSVLLITLFFYSIDKNNILWGIFGWIFGLLLISGLIEFAYRMDIREVFRDRRQILFSGAVTLLILAAFGFDLFGYTAWMPKRDDVESVHVRVQRFGDYNLGEEERCEYELDFDGTESDIYAPMTPDTEAGYAELEDMGVVYDLIAKSLDIDREAAAKAAPDAKDHVMLYVNYHFKDGTVKKRRYEYTHATFAEAYAEIWEENREVIYPILQVKPEDVLGVRTGYWDGWAFEAPGEQFTLQQAREIVKSFQEDCRTMSFEEVFEETNEDYSMENGLDILYRDEHTGKIYSGSYWLNDGCRRTEERIREYLGEE